MVVCKFFLEGRCKFGDSCKKEHPGRNTTSTRNPFAPLLNNNRPAPSGQNTSNKAAKSTDYPYHLDKDIISRDLTNDRPLYILSAYGPGRDAPRQLFGGQPREQSFEELRLRHYELASTGNEAQAIQEAQTLYGNAEQQIQTALTDLNGAIKYITDATNEHPNRLDICKANGGDLAQLQQLSSASRLGTSPSSNGPAFGQPSFGQPSAPAFGKPSFGQVAAPAPAFGQPTSLGQKPTVFGSNPTPAPAFGQTSTPSLFNQPQQPVNSFGTQQQPQSQPLAFGQTSTPSPFNQAQQAPKPFGTQEPIQQPTFGQQSNAFEKQPLTAPQPSNIFGQQQTQNPSNPLPNAPATTSTFGQPNTTPANLFNGAEAPQPSNVFGKFSAPQPATNPFGPKDPPQNLGTFGQARQLSAPPSTQAPSSTGVFAKPADGAAFKAPAAASMGPVTQASNRIPADAKFETDREGKRRLLSWQGQRVTYFGEDPCIKNPRDNEWQKIWFPEGAPKFTSKTQEYPDGYAPGEKARANFRQFFEHGVGMDGLVPDMPPPRDMISWDF
ncbi:MAG: hypothetical protein Q9219_001032 [cf. Caloplaca sp. 3 TL-2023]